MKSRARCGCGSKTGRKVLLAPVFAGLIAGNVWGFNPAAGDFSKPVANSVRVLTWNVHDNFIFNANKDAAFRRVIEAADPDVICLQEFHNDMGTEAELVAAIKARLESYSLSGNTWHVYMGKTDGANRNALCSRYPLSMTRKDTIPASDIRGVTMGLVDLPDATYASDLYVMCVHFKCCNELADFQQRQVHADAVTSWMKDARTAGGNVTLPANTPMVVVGDLNISDAGDKAPYHPERTMITGDIYDTATFGASSAPDWDGTNAGDAAPYDHTNASPNTHSSGDPSSRIDRFIYTDSVMHVTGKFVLNTGTMSGAALTAGGLAVGDSAASDHLPCVTDFALGGVSAPNLLINEFCANDAGTDDRSFIELINTGGEEINLDAPVDYWIKTSDPLPASSPSAENESAAFNLRGVVPPGGLFVLYNGAADSSGIKTAVESALPALQRQNAGAFTLPDANNTAISLASRGRSGYLVVSEKNVEAYGYAAGDPGITRYFMLDAPNQPTITLGAARWTGFNAGGAGVDQTLSRNLGTTLSNNYSAWTIGTAATPGQANATTFIVDNSNAGFTASASWSTGTSAADKYGNDYRFRLTEAVSDQATWNISVPAARNYEIYAWWSQGANRSISAPFILPGGTTVYKNQQTGGGSWQSLGIVPLVAGSNAVKLSCWTTNGSVVIGDAVRAVPR